MTLPGGTRLGPYEILSPLGAGGMGEVYRMRDTRPDLIRESRDFALIGQSVYAALLRPRVRDAIHLDEAWFCCTGNPHRPDQWHGFHGPQEILDRVNSPTVAADAKALGVGES